MRTLLTIARKDATIIVRDRAALLVMLAMPLGLIFILGSALGSIGEGDSLDIGVAIVNEDAGETGELFVDGLTSSEEIDELFNIDVRDDAEAVRTDVEKGDLTAALITSVALMPGIRWLPSPGADVGQKIMAAVREITHIEGDKGKTLLALGMRNDSLELKVKIKVHGAHEKVRIEFPK